MTARMRLNVPLLPILVGIALFMQLIDPSRIWTILLIALGGAWLSGYLWARSLKENLHLTREMRFGWAQVGDHLEERFTITNQGWFPAPGVEVTDRSTLPGYNVTRATGVDGQSESQWLTDGICTRRGLYRLGGTTLQTGDPLGIYSVSIDNPDSTTLMVMPPVVPLPSIDVTPAGYSGEGRPRPNTPEQTVGAASVRTYLPGDSLRLIHWPTSARHDQLYVRLFDGAPAGDWWIVLDLDRRAQAGQGGDSTEEHGVILAASLADRGLRARQAVGLVVNGADLIWMPPEAGDHQRWEILRALTLARPGDASLAALLERVRPALGHHASLMVITPSVEADWLQALIPLTWRGIMPTILLLDPESFGGNGSALPLAGTLNSMGITRHLITRDLLDRPEARPGLRGQWEWRYTPTGRAIPVRSPADMTWRRLSK
jgi:uncharacterized protein (DUF58 family)